MSILTFRQPAEPGQVFAQDAFVETIGRSIPVTVGTDPGPPWPPGQPWRTATLVAARVSEDGSYADLTVNTGPLRNGEQYERLALLSARPRVHR